MTTREKRQRVQTLIRLGMSAIQAERILNNLSQPNRPSAISSYSRTATEDKWAFLKNYTFGVEIECNVNSFDFAQQADNTGLSLSFERYNHNDRTDNTFKCVPDSSIQGANAIEVVSPVLKGNDGFTHLKKVCETLGRADAKVNKSCGLHVHIGNTLTEFQRVLLVDIYSACEKHIDDFMAPSRRANKNFFCKSVHDLEANILGNNTFFVDVAGAYDKILSYGRYYKVNLTAMRTHGTIEFRQHQGSVDFEKISNWVKFCMCLVHYCEDATIDNFCDKVGSVELSRTVEDLPFLPDELKAYYKQRTEHFANR